MAEFAGCDCDFARRESRIARPRSSQHREDLWRRGEAWFNERRKSETGPRPDCCFDRAELFEAGVELEKIDEKLVKWGMPMGPLRLIDEIGIDVTIDIASTLEKGYGRRDRAPEILKRMREAKLLGRKSGSGFYNYEGKQQLPNELLTPWRRKDSPKDE